MPKPDPIIIQIDSPLAKELTGIEILANYIDLEGFSAHPERRRSDHKAVIAINQAPKIVIDTYRLIPYRQLTGGARYTVAGRD